MTDLRRRGMMYQTILKSLPEKIAPFLSQGDVADYIPALGSVPRNKFGIAATQTDQGCFKAGDANESFSLQSISKVFALTLAVQILGDKIWERVGKRLSARAFNSIMPIEEAGGLPRNPFTNEGAIAMTDLLITHDRKYLDNLITFVRKVTGNQAIDYDMTVAGSEKQNGHRNAAIAHFLKSYGILNSPVDQVLEHYFIQCSLAMSCTDLSRSLVFLANQGRDPFQDRQILTPNQTRRLNALLLMFGTYDAAGEFVFKIGLPGKSGVGGGILAVIPQKMTISVWSPALDHYGTSVAGLKALEMLTENTGLSIL